MIEIIEPGLATTVQDHGRPGWAALGVPPSGALDRSAHDRANALVGNAPDTATIEVVGGGLRMRALDRHVVALTGAWCVGVPMDVAFTMEPGDVLALEPPAEGACTYVAVAGGVDVPRVLGSRSTDRLSRLGPAPLGRGDVVPVGGASEVCVAASPPPGLVPPRAAPSLIRIWPGPRTDRHVDPLGHLTAHAWEVGRDLDRVGIRLTGSPLVRTRSDELPSEGLVTGAVQVPHDGRPIVMLADHPTTGGYPVVAVVDPADVDLLAHLRPGDRVRFVLVSGAATDEGIT